MTYTSIIVLINGRFTSLWLDKLDGIVHKYHVFSMDLNHCSQSGLLRVNVYPSHFAFGFPNNWLCCYAKHFL